MHERHEDLVELQRVVDASFDAAGSHLRDIATPDRRLDAEQLAARLTGMRLLVLATSTHDGRPINGPVDGVFYRGRFHFGSSPESLRYRHIRERPAVSATHLPDESLAVTVHGDAELLDVHAAEHAEFKQTILDIYTHATARNGRQCWTAEPGTTRINPQRIFTFSMPEIGPGESVGR